MENTISFKNIKTIDGLVHYRISGQPVCGSLKYCYGNFSMEKVNCPDCIEYMGQFEIDVEDGRDCYGNLE